MKIHSHKGSALIIAMMITGVIMIIALYLFEKVVPVSSATKGIENSNAAYYQALSAVEETQSHISPANPGTDYSSGTTGTRRWNVSTVANGSTIPLAGQGNSEYNKDYNRIAPGHPVQLSLKNLLNLSGVSVLFQTFSGPSLDSGLSGSGVIIWTLSSGSGTLFANTGSMINGDKIINKTIITDIGLLSGITDKGIPSNIASYFNTNCTPPNTCILKFIIVTPLISSTGNSLPYLEYQFKLPNGVIIPQQYTTITADGYSAGFRQTITKKIQQSTTNEALDFTVFQ